MMMPPQLVVGGRVFVPSWPSLDASDGRVIHSALTVLAHDPLQRRYTMVRTEHCICTCVTNRIAVRPLSIDAMISVHGAPAALRRAHPPPSRKARSLLLRVTCQPMSRGLRRYRRTHAQARPSSRYVYVRLDQNAYACRSDASDNMCTTTPLPGAAYFYFYCGIQRS